MNNNPERMENVDEAPPIKQVAEEQQKPDDEPLVKQDGGEQEKYLEPGEGLIHRARHMYLCDPEARCSNWRSLSRKEQRQVMIAKAAVKEDNRLWELMQEKNRNQNNLQVRGQAHRGGRGRGGLQTFGGGRSRGGWQTFGGGRGRGGWHVRGGGRGGFHVRGVGRGEWLVRAGGQHIKVRYNKNERKYNIRIN